MSHTTTTSYTDHFRAHGWCTIRLQHLGALEQLRHVLLDELRKITAEPAITLEQYHQYVTDDAIHTKHQVHLTAYLRRLPHLHAILRENMNVVVALVGADSRIQAEPYLRIVRPGQEQDTIGYHRDTFYGGSPYEISVLIPFVDLPAGAALRVQSNSHRIPEAAIPLHQVPSPEVTKGSAKHKLGFLYAPKLIDQNYPLHMMPVPLAVGDVLVFSLATLHGSTGNDSMTTRWSSDMRIVNTFAPVDLQLRPTYYQPFASSPATDVANEYFSVNAAQPAPVK